MVDACYGGLLNVPLRGVGLRDEDVEEMRQDAYLREVQQQGARLIMTAGSAEEKVLDLGGADHSVFTGRFIQAITSAQHFITAKTVFAQVRQKVSEDAAANHHTQTPQLGYWEKDGDFVFILK